MDQDRDLVVSGEVLVAMVVGALKAHAVLYAVRGQALSEIVHANLLNGDHIQPSCSAEKVYAMLHPNLAAPSWLSGKVLGKGKGEGPCFKVKFADGYTHPGVPYAHIRRLEQA